MTFRDTKTIDDIVDFVDHVGEERKATFIRVIIDQADERVFQKLVHRMGDELLDHLLNYLKLNKKKSRNVIRFLVHFRHKQSAHALLDILKDMDQDGEEYEEILRLFMDLKDVWIHDLEGYLREEDYVFPVIRACGILGLNVPEGALHTVFCSSALNTKREIMKQLSRISCGNGNRIIREALKDSDGHVQADAVAIAGNLSLKELTSDILILARRGYPDVRAKALLALLRIDKPMALAAIEWFVKEGTPEDKRIYLSVTSHIDAETNFPFLEELIMSGDERVRQMAIRVVGNFVDHEPYLQLFETVFRAGNAPNEMLKVIGEKRLMSFKKPLLDIVQDPLQALWTRYHALSALGAFADRTLMPVFVGSLKEKDNLIKIGGLKALAELNDKKVVPHIRPYTKSADDDVKMAAMAALGKLTSSEAVC
jgi:HEAT repeat protein